MPDQKDDGGTGCIVAFGGFMLIGALATNWGKEWILRTRTYAWSDVMPAAIVLAVMAPVLIILGLWGAIRRKWPPWS